MTKHKKSTKLSKTACAMLRKAIKANMKDIKHISKQNKIARDRIKKRC